MREDTTIFTLLYVAHATDRDPVVYTLANTTQTTFAINSTGYLILTAPLDAEVIVQYRLIIQANNSVYIANQSVIIYVLNVVDTPPQFSPPSPFNASVFDNSSVGVPLLQLRVVDPDIGTNSSIEFVLPLGGFGGLFALNATSGLLFLNGTLKGGDIQSFYALLVMARRTLYPSQNTTGLVLITVLDVNSVTPTFTSPVYVFYVLENSTLGALIGTVHALDSDRGSNGMVTYATSGDSPFLINGTSGEIVVNGTLDRETTPAYWLVVVAIDRGTPPRSSSCLVNITVLDANDNLPIFVVSYISISIPEHLPAPTYVATVHADDRDGGVVLYFLPPENLTLFAINSTTGVVTAKKSFDYDAGETHFVVVVIAMDQGNPPLFSQAIIDLNITEGAKYPPRFPADQLQLLVPENLPINSTVVVVEANGTEPGLAGVVTYSLVGVPALYPFQINSSSGAIYLVSSLDRETTPFYYFRVQATKLFEDEVLTSILVVNVTVQDVNDNAPFVTVLENPVTILTTHPVGGLVTTVMATDPDLGDNGTVRFILCNPGGYFDISATNGSILTTVPLPAVGNFSLFVTATDLGTPPLATNVTIVVLVVKPVAVTFAQQGAGFLFGQQRGTPTQPFGFFLNVPSASNGTIFARLGGVEASATYTTQLPVAASVSGILLSQRVWLDQPSVLVLVQVRDEAGDVHCSPSGVVVRAVPDSSLASVLNVVPQVMMHSEGWAAVSCCRGEGFNL